MRPIFFTLVILLSVVGAPAQEHATQLRNIIDSHRLLQMDIERLERTIEQETLIAEQLFGAVIAINDPQEHNGAEKAMEHVRTARRLSEEGDESIHLREIILEATELVENHRDWIHSSDLYEVHERYHHTVIHPLTVELAEDLIIVEELSERGVQSEGLELLRRRVDELLLDLLRYSDVRYE